MEEGAYTEDGFRDFFRQYRLLLEKDFQDLLTVGMTRATPDATDKADSLDEEPAEPVGDTNRRARLWGAAIAVTAFLVILFEFRYFRFAIPFIWAPEFYGFRKLLLTSMADIH